MHEAALLADLMARLERLAREEGAARITRVEVRLGALSHMTAGHFRKHFADASRGTPAEGAEVVCIVSDDIDDPDAAGVRLLRAAVT